MADKFKAALATLAGGSLPYLLAMCFAMQLIYLILNSVPEVGQLLVELLRMDTEALARQVELTKERKADPPDPSWPEFTYRVLNTSTTQTLFQMNLKRTFGLSGARSRLCERLR